MDKIFEPEGQTTSDNFLMSERGTANEQSLPQSEWKGLTCDEEKYVTQKGLKTPGDLLRSYRELEKAYSSKISLPKDGDEEALHKLYVKLGMPDDVSGFDIKFEDVDAKLGEGFKQACLKNNILPKSANALYDWFVKERAAQIKQSEEEWLKQSELEMEEQKNEWGAKAVRNMALVKRGVKLFANDDEEAVYKMEQALGTKRLMQICCKLGEAVSEDNPISFGGGDKRQKSFDPVEFFNDMFADHT